VSAPRRAHRSDLRVRQPDAPHQAAAAALFGAAPPVPTDVLARAFQTDAGVVDTVKSKFAPPK
jgi:hypothetical protein